MTLHKSGNQHAGLQSRFPAFDALYITTVENLPVLQGVIVKVSRWTTGNPMMVCVVKKSQIKVYPRESSKLKTKFSIKRAKYTMMLRRYFINLWRPHRHDRQPSDKEQTKQD